MKNRLMLLFLAIPAIFVAMDDSSQKVVPTMGTVVSTTESNTSRQNEAVEANSIINAIMIKQLELNANMRKNTPATCCDKCDKGCKLCCSGCGDCKPRLCFIGSTLCLCGCCCCCDYSQSDLETVG